MRIERVENGYIVTGPVSYTTRQWVFTYLSEALLHIAQHVGRVPIGASVEIKFPNDPTEAKR